MIASVRGVLLERNPDQVVIEAAGVGYLITITAAAYKALPPAGAEARLFVYTHATQDSGLQLFGFADPDERRVFETLLSVQGVGPRVAVAILSGLPLPELVRAIASENLGLLTQIRGVGRKIAERLTVELREKIVALGVAGKPPTVPGGPPSGRLGEVYGALIELGYRPAEIEALVPTLDASQPAPELVKQALAALRRK